MLTKVDIRNAQRSTLTLTLGDSSNGYEVQDIDGLDPVNATISSSTFVGLAGEQYHSSQREKRNVTMVLGFKPDYVNTSVFSLRSNLYSFLMPDSPVTLTFYDDSGLTVKIDGRVESCEAPPFSKEPKANISIICFDPDFIESDPELHTYLSTTDTTEILVPYSGNVDSPGHIAFNIEFAVPGITVYHRPPDGMLHTINITYAFQANDSLEFESAVGSKGLTLTRNGVVSSLLYAKEPQSPWLVLQKGDNYIRVYTATAGMPYSLSYYNRYGGL